MVGRHARTLRHRDFSARRVYGIVPGADGPGDGGLGGLLVNIAKFQRVALGVVLHDVVPASV